MGNYLGRGMDDITTANITVDSFDGDGVTNELTISQRNIPSSINNITVYIDGVQQRAVTDFTLSNSTITLTSTPSSGQKIVAVTKGDATLSFISDSTVVAESFADGAITNDKLVSFDASKLTGTFNAIDGSALTGITEVTVASSDPTITTNPDNVGDIYVNSTTGEMFSCTDKTTDENVWINVGGGSGDTFTFQGRIAGYTVGGSTVDNIPANGLNSIEKYAFASSGMSVADHGDASVVKGMSAGHTGALHGYVTGGGPAAPGVSTNVIERYAYSSNAGTDDVGDLTRAENQHAGVSGTTDGYVVTGYSQSTAITKFSFESSSSSVNIGNVTIQRYSTAGINSSTDGYVTGGYKNVAPTGVQTSTEKFSFSSGSNSAHGSMTNIGSGFDGNGISSTTHGYAIGGYIIPDVNGLPRTGHIDKFSFSSSANGTSIGEISDVTNTGGHWSSTTHGYYYGGRHTSFYTAIRRFDYSTETIQNSVGTLSSGRVYPSSANQ